MGSRVNSLASGIFCLIVAAASYSAELLPYKAVYKTNALGIDVTLDQTLSLSDGHYELLNKASVFIVGLEERSNFTIENDQVIGEHFTYKLTGLGNRKREVIFDPENGLIKSLKKKTWTELPYSPDILDRLSQQAQLRLELMRASELPETLTFTVVDGATAETRELVLAGAEILDTRAGKLRTIHYRQIHDNPEKRKSDICLAVDYDYLMVQTIHVEKDSTIKILLQSAKIGDEEVVGLDPTEAAIASNQIFTVDAVATDETAATE